MSKKLLNDFSFGFELEGTFNLRHTDYNELNRKFDRLLGGEGCMHGDGSLRAEDGWRTFEYSSPVIRYTPQNIKQVIKFLDMLPELHVKTNATCGFHTHISYNGINKRDVAWAIASMVADESYKKFLKLGRFNMHKAPYASAKFLNDCHRYFERKNLRHMAYIIMDNEKYRSIRIHPQGTIEWRGPRTFLNVNKHSKNVAFFKKLTEFMLRISKSLDEIESNGLFKKDFMVEIERCANSVSFKEQPTKKIDVDRLLHVLSERSYVINNLSESSLQALSEKILHEGINVSRIVRSLKVNNYMIKSSIALKELMKWTDITNFIELIDVNMYKDNITMIGNQNGLTKTFEYLLKNPGVNDAVLNMLINKALTKFGSSSIKTFSYNAMLEMMKYNINAFKVAINKNLEEVFGSDRASYMIKQALRTESQSRLNSEIYGLLMNSPNADLVNRIYTAPRFMNMEVLNTTIDNVLSA